MSGNQSVGARILAAHAHHCEHVAAELAAARAAGVPASELAELEAQELAARKRYQELAVDMPLKGRRPWWRLW